MRNLLPGSVLVITLVLEDGNLFAQQISMMYLLYQSTAEIKQLPISENGRLPYYNSISGLVFGVISVFLSTVNC